VKQWSGLWPCSPDGLPYIGPAGPDCKGVFIATGHAMMGLSLGPVTGKLMADIICGNTNKFDLKTMSPLRFC
jgi:D-amino-acid dehydrogenase